MTASDAALGELFGSSVAISVDTLQVGILSKMATREPPMYPSLQETDPNLARSRDSGEIEQSSQETLIGRVEQEKRGQTERRELRSIV